MVVNNHLVINDVKVITETILPETPNTVFVTNLIGGSKILQLSLPEFITDVLCSKPTRNTFCLRRGRDMRPRFERRRGRPSAAGEVFLVGGAFVARVASG